MVQSIGTVELLTYMPSMVLNGLLCACFRFGSANGVDGVARVQTLADAPREFESVLGPGYRLRRVWIEMTNAPVTRNIVERLPWLDGFKGVTGRQFDGSWKIPGQNLYASHFRRIR